MKTFYKLGSMLLCSAFLLCNCTKENPTDGDGTQPGGTPGEVREVMVTLKNQLVLQKGATKATGAGSVATKAEAPIATAAENAISTLDVYVFGAKTENGDYTFQERFAYRADSKDRLPQGATELLLNAGSDGKETTALIKLKKGLFVKLYCIANDTTLVDPATDKVVKAADFTPITFTESEDGTPRFAAEGKPQESTFVGWHTRLLTAAVKADTLAPPLAMAGACTTPIDLTSFDNSARVQVGFRLTRLVARFDINNKAGDSRFTIETVSMGNGRRGSGLFPIRVYGNLPEAEPDQLITYPVHAFYGDNANNGLCTGAFYAYPSPRQDKAFLILNGKYKVNETEMKNVSYQIPFTQPKADGNAAWLDIAGNHRYTIAVTKADAYHLDANILVTDWADDGSIEYTPDNKPGEIVVTIPEAFKGDSEYDADTKTVSMSLKEGSSFEITTTSNSALIISKAYAGGGIVKGYDWISISDPDITLGANGISTYKYTATLTKPYLAGRYPKAAIRCISLTDASESILYVEALSVPQPIATQQPPKTPNNRSDNPNNFDVDKLEASLYRITGSTTRVYINCPDGVEPAEHPDWLDVTPASVDGASTLFLLTLNNRDLPVDGNQGTVVFCNKKKNELQTGITVNIMDAPVKTDYTAVGSDNTYTPGTSDGTTPDDLAIRIKENSSATVKASSIDGVEVKIDYPEGTPEWLSFTEATATTATTTATATKATASLRTQDITFKPIERSMGGAQKATVTLVNIIGGKNYSFTVTPVYATPVLSVISTSAKPAQNTFVAGDDASTLTLYRVSGSTIQLKATAIGGSRATDPAGVTVSGGDTYQTENTYTVTLAAGATSGSFNIVNKSDPAKIHTVTVQAPVATITSKNVTLAVNLNQTATAATSSPEGFTASVTNWGGGGAWFDLPTKDFGKNNVNVTVKVNASLGNIGIKPATVTLKNKIAGGGDITFTVTPTLGTPAVKRVSAIPTGNTPATNNATLGNNTTLTLYKLATATNYVLSATCYGGSKAVMSGSGFTLSPNNSVSTNVTQNYTLTATATSGSGSVTIYNADSKNPVTFPVSIKNGVMTLDKSEITLTPANGSAQGLKLTSGAGYKSYSVNWNGGSGWFGLPSSVAGGTNVAFNVTANTANSNPKEATVTLVNAIEGAPNLTNLKVKVGATAPKVTSYSNPSITTATAVSANTGSGTNVELWAVDNSSIQVTIDAIGGSCVYSQTNVNVTGGNTTNQQNTFTITSTNGSQGSFVIANKVAPNLDKLTFTVKKKADAISANNLSVTAALSGATNISVNSNLGCTASVLNNNWGSGGGQWFNFKTADVNYGNNKTIQIEQLSTNNNTIMKPVTIRLTSKASGGATKDITVTPTGFAAPTLSATSGSDADFYLNKGTTFTFTTTSVGGGTDATTSNSDVATVTRTNNTYTVTPKGLGSCTISVPNASNTNLKSNYTVTISGKVNYQGKAVWKYYGFYIAPEDAGSSVWNTSLTANYCSNKSGATWYVPSADEWRAILGGTSGSNNAASTVYNEYRRKGVFTTNLHYWSTTENDDDSTYAYDMRIYNTNAYVTYYYKAASRQVRCVSR